MTKLLDQTGDVGGQELYRLARAYPLPEFVKQAALSQLYDAPQPHARYYADTRKPLQFTCHSPEATVLSALYFYDKQAQFAPSVAKNIQSRLDDFASYWHVDNAVQAIKRAAQENCASKQAAERDEDFAILARVGEATKRRVPLRDSAEVKAAAAWFVANLPVMRQHMTFANRQSVATRILDKAAEHAAALDSKEQETLEKSAGYGTAAPSTVAAAIRQRVQLGRQVEPAVKQSMLELADTLGKRAELCTDNAYALKVADALDGFDRATGLLNSYGDFLPSPEDSLFELSRSKLAQSLENACCLTNGELYTPEQLSQLKTADLLDAFGEDFVREVSAGLRLDTQKLAAVAATLPRPEADMLSALLQEQNQRPLYKESALGVGISEAQWQDILSAAT